MIVTFPRIDAKAYTNLLNKIAAGGRVMCQYCGNENVALGDTWVCAYCENANYASILAIKLRDAELVKSLNLVNDYLSESDFDSALAEYEKILDSNDEPGFHYRYAQLIIQYSNYEVASIRYDRPGFMEENALHRELSGTLDSRAKMILSKTAVACEIAFRNGNKDPFVLHAYFMSNLKLKNLKTAKRASEMTAMYSKPLQEYQQMALAAELGDATATATTADSQIKKVFSPINAFYYLTWSLVRAKRLEDAKVFITKLSGYIPNSSVKALEKEITNAMQVA